MSEVYKAEDIKLRRTVALKFVSGELMENPEARSRLLQLPPGTPFIAMELIDGKSFDAVAR